MNRSQLEDFQDISDKNKAVLPRTLDTPRETGNIWYNQDPERTQLSYKPTKISETPKEIRRDRRRQIARKQSTS